MKPARKTPIVVVRPVRDTDKAKAAAAALRSRQILSGTAALHRYIERLEALEAAGWNWK
jgi:hypothetical protein